MVVLIILIVAVVVLAGALFIIGQRLRDLKSGGSVELLKADVTELNRTITTLQTSLGDKLERNATNMQSSMQKQLTESMKLVSDVSQRLTKLDETNRRVVDVADELKTLQNVLQNPKQRGVFGEYYLESVLTNILPVKQFKIQYGFKAYPSHFFSVLHSVYPGHNRAENNRRDHHLDELDKAIA